MYHLHLRNIYSTLYQYTVQRQYDNSNYTEYRYHNTVHVYNMPKGHMKHANIL